YPDTKYVDGLIGADTVNTIPLETINAFLDHGKVRRTVDEGLVEAEQVLADLKRVGIDLDAITEQLLKDGVKAFADSYHQLLKTLGERKSALT
ncbi:MAG TPA: transaldolase family protein, partial [Dehalococcoidales bacterium]|nr:transaldolase family protein [Dehalococcoidales bacterium]